MSVSIQQIYYLENMMLLCGRLCADFMVRRRIFLFEETDHFRVTANIVRPMELMEGTTRVCGSVTCCNHRRINIGEGQIKQELSPV